MAIHCSRLKRMMLARVVLLYCIQVACCLWFGSEYHYQLHTTCSFVYTTPQVNEVNPQLTWCISGYNSFVYVVVCFTPCAVEQVSRAHGIDGTCSKCTCMSY